MSQSEGGLVSLLSRDERVPASGEREREAEDKDVTHPKLGFRVLKSIALPSPCLRP